MILIFENQAAMKKKSILYILIVTSSVFFGCNNATEQTNIENKDSALSCEMNLPSRFTSPTNDSANITAGEVSHDGMIFIDGGNFLMGAGDKEGRADEYPQHQVQVSGFWIDATEVTNKQFKKFVDATGYLTTAEKIPDWEEMKKQLPPGTPKPADSILVAASLVFTVSI